MVLIGYSLSGLIGAAIVVIGARFLWGPATASGAFGIAESPPLSNGFTAWLAVKGLRDIVSGLFVFLLMANGPPRLLGEFLLVASLITARRRGDRPAIGWKPNGRVRHSWAHGAGHHRDRRQPHRRGKVNRGANHALLHTSIPKTDGVAYCVDLYWSVPVQRQRWRGRAGAVRALGPAFSRSPKPAGLAHGLAL